MEREIMHRLLEWKQRSNRKPLILLGARQVGKTFILKEFGRRYYDHVAYINCDNSELVKDLFTEDYNIQRILLAVSAIAQVPVVPEKTLIIFDEIQELRRGLNALKYFCEDAPQYHVAVAGSLLGITMHHGESYPVGKVNILRMTPMTFEEFLDAKGFEKMAQLIRDKEWDVVNDVHTHLTQLLREYYFVGGMPEAVHTFIDTNDATAVRQVQQEILTAYDKDMSKHAPANEAVRINQVWRSIPAQLAKENRKFVYGAVRKGARANDFEIAIQWLLDAGLVHKIERVTRPAIPLKCYAEMSAFKLYLLDCGLLGAMSDIPPSMMLLPNDQMPTKGYFTENFVCCQLCNLLGDSVYYFSKDNSSQEVDFIIQGDTDACAIEVKAETNLHSKSLRAFHEENPQVRCVRASMAAMRDQEWMTNVPVYALRGYFG